MKHASGRLPHVKTLITIISIDSQDEKLILNFTVVDVSLIDAMLNISISCCAVVDKEVES